jgi:hypothetical protein
MHDMKSKYHENQSLNTKKTFDCTERYQYVIAFPTNQFNDRKGQKSNRTITNIPM